MFAVAVESFCAVRLTDRQLVAIHEQNMLLPNFSRTTNYFFLAKRAMFETIPLHICRNQLVTREYFRL